jgi:AcrR family transcriptional regulator
MKDMPRFMEQVKRARSTEDKAQRKSQILKAAGQLVAEGDYRDITMADIASRASLAKGTLFLYFETKEELFLALAVDRFEAFFGDVERSLGGLARKPAADARRRLKLVQSALSGALGSDPVLLKLIVLLGPIIEGNSRLESILEMKRFMLVRMAALGARLEGILPGLGPGSGTVFLNRLYGIAVGYLNLANPSGCVKLALERADMAPFRFDFRANFEETAACLLAGMME